MAGKVWTYKHKTTVHFGPGALEMLPDAANPLAGSKKILLVTDNSGTMEKTGVLGRVLDMLGRDRVAVFDQVPPNPRTTDIHDGVALHRKEDCHLIVGLGGGSPLDAAKGIAVMRNAEGDLAEYLLQKRPWPNTAEPIIAIPTTAGTGSEVNANLVATLPSQVKIGLATPCTWPMVALVDPTLTLTLPKYQTGSTGLDALSHALESLWAVRSQPVSDMNAYEAVRVIMKALPVAYNDGANLEARTQMAFGSMVASFAFGHTGTAAVHALSYDLTTRWNMPHGYACSFTMPELLKYNLPALDEEKRRRIVESLGANSEADAVTKLRDFCITHGTPAKLGDVGITEKDIPALAAGANPINMSNNIRPATASDLEEILRKKL